MVRRLLALVAVVAASFFAFAGPAAAADYTPTTATGAVSDASPAVGHPVVFSAAGFRVSSTVAISLAGRHVTDVTADVKGAVSATVTAPSAAGTYVLAASGVAADGAPRTVTVSIRVLGAQAASAVPAAGTSGLPRTGTEVATQLWIGGGLLAFGAGLVALTVVRRRDVTTVAA